MRGLLVDWGGVLTTNIFDSFRAYCLQSGLEADAVIRALSGDEELLELLVGLETGRLPETVFERALAARLGIEGWPGLIDRLFEGARPDEAMRNAVRRARAAGVRTGLLSNSWSVCHYPRQVVIELFDAVTISGEAGLRKPDPRIYGMAAERLGVEPAACAFADDLAVNLEPAAALGMATVHHVETEATLAELERLLGLPLR